MPSAARTARVGINDDDGRISRRYIYYMREHIEAINSMTDSREWRSIVYVLSRLKTRFDMPADFRDLRCLMMTHSPDSTR